MQLPAVSGVNQKIAAYCALTRLYMSVVLGLAAVCGNYLVSHTFPSAIALAVFLCQLCIFAADFALNDILDVTRDASVSYKPLPAGRITLRSASVVFVLLSGVGLAIAHSLCWSLLWLCLAQILLIGIYSWIKTRLTMAASLVTGLWCASAFLAGALTVGISRAVWIPMGLTVLFTVAREIVKDALDKEQDERAGLRTVPIIWGDRVASIIVGVIVAVVITLSLRPEVQRLFGAGYLPLIGSVDITLCIAVWLYIRQPNRIGASRFLLVTAGAFPLALLAFLI